MESISYDAPPTVTESESAPIVASVSSEVSDYKPLYDKFEASQNPRTDRIFGEIWEWAKAQAPLKDKDSILWEVTKLSNRLGSTHYGEKPWSKVIAYVSTDRQMRQAENRLKEMEAK